jgi:hypothetical protein
LRQLQNPLRHPQVGEIDHLPVNRHSTLAGGFSLMHRIDNSGERMKNFEEIKPVIMVGMNI